MCFCCTCMHMLSHAYTCSDMHAHALTCMLTYIQWMSVQELWQNLEAVFNSPLTAKEFPEEAVRFVSTHRDWLKLMRVAHQTRAVLSCCSGGDPPTHNRLATIASGLEECKKSLESYLTSKRQVRIKFC